MNPTPPPPAPFPQLAMPAREALLSHRTAELDTLAAQLRALASSNTELSHQERLLTLLHNWRDPQHQNADAQTARETCADALEDLLGSQALLSDQGVLELISHERARQQDDGWKPEHDDHLTGGELALAAASYALLGAGAPVDDALSVWPQDWTPQSLHPRSGERNLLKAAALIIAELERRARQTRALTRQVLEAINAAGQEEAAGLPAPAAGRALPDRAG